MPKLEPSNPAKQVSPPPETFSPTTKRKAGGDDGTAIQPVKSKKHQSSPAAAVATTSQDDGSIIRAKSRKKRASKPNIEKVPGPNNVKKLALGRQAVSSRIAVNSEPHSDIERLNLYHLGPLMTVYEAFPYLVNFATDVEGQGPFAMDVATSPKTALMLKIDNDTVFTYARSRLSRFLLDVPTDPSDKDVEVTEPVELDLDLLKEPINITRAATFEQERNVESWTLDIIYGTAGLRVGDKVERCHRSTINDSTSKLMPLIKPAKLQGTSTQTLTRTRYYWALLASFRMNGASFIVAFRPSTVDSILLLDVASG